MLKGFATQRWYTRDKSLYHFNFNFSENAMLIYKNSNKMFTIAEAYPWYTWALFSNMANIAFCIHPNHTAFTIYFNQFVVHHFIQRRVAKVHALILHQAAYHVLPPTIEWLAMAGTAWCTEPIVGISTATNQGCRQCAHIFVVIPVLLAAAMLPILVTGYAPTVQTFITEQFSSRLCNVWSRE